MEGLAGLLNQPADVNDLYEGDNLKEGVDPMEVVKGWYKTRLDDFSRQSTAREWKKLEKWVKAQGFESDLQGTDLLSAFADYVKGTAGKSTGDQKAEKKIQELEAAITNLQTALAAKEDEVKTAAAAAQRQIVSARLRGAIRDALGSKWAGTEDHFNILASQFNPDQIRIEPNGALTLLNDNGEPLTDEYHRPIQFGERVQKVGALIGGFHAVDPGKGSPPAGSPGNAAGAGSGITLAAGITGLEFQQMLGKEQDPEKRAKLIHAYKERLNSK